MDIEQQIAETMARHAVEDAAGRRAAAEPLPGPLHDAFAIQPDIAVGPYKVRPFYDIDFEYLSLLDHPLYKMISGSDHDFVPRGPHAWELCWIMTRDVDVSEEIIKKLGVAALKDAARKEFGRMRLPALSDINAAIVKQLTIYWSPVIAYGAPAQEGEQEPNPTKSSVQP